MIKTRCLYENTTAEHCEMLLQSDSVFSPPIPSLAPIHCLVGSDQAAGKQAGGVHYKKRERLRSIYTSHTSSGKPDGVALHYTLSHP